MLTACTSCSIPMSSTLAYAHPAEPHGLSLSLLVEGHLTAVLTPALLLEYEERLCGDVTLHGLGLTDDDLVALLDELVSRSIRVRIYWLWRPVAPDPDDDMVIECAVNGRAEVIVTFNTRHLQPAYDRFGILVLTPAAFLRRFGRQA
jgi:predicted nucleic acid-binding protein